MENSYNPFQLWKPRDPVQKTLSRRDYFLHWSFFVSITLLVTLTSVVPLEDENPGYPSGISRKVNRNKIRYKEYPLVFLEFLLLWSLYQKWIANFCLLFSSPDSVIALGRAVRITWCGRWEGQLYYENGYGIWGNTLDFTLSSIDIFFPNNLYSWWENFQLCCLLLSFDLIPLSAWSKSNSYFLETYISGTSVILPIFYERVLLCLWVSTDLEKY